jgi:hypothetical protein
VQVLVAKLPADPFVNTHQKKMSGWADIAALHAHFNSHQNKAKLKAEAGEHYKTKKALSFNVYLQCIEKMIQLYVQAEEPMFTLLQINFLFNNIPCELLSSTMLAIKYVLAVSPNMFKLILAYSHFSGEVKKVNIPVKCGISSTLTNVGSIGSGNDSAHRNSYGSLDAAPLKEWFALLAKE